MAKKVMTLPRCFACKSNRLERTEKRQEYPIGTTTFTADVPVTQCQDCGETTMSAVDLGRFEVGVALALMDRRQSCKGFKFLRKKAGLPAKELAPLLQVAPETISDWENHTMPPRAAWLVVGALFKARLAGTLEAQKKRLLAMNSVEYPECAVELPSAKLVDRLDRNP